MNYTGQHRDNTPRPECTCNAPRGTRWTGHDAACAIRVEVAGRLLTGQGGTR